MGSTRIQREYTTVAAMVRLYCRRQHGGGQPDGVCPECRELLEYARQRLTRCPFGEGKTACAQCSVHCYGPRQRQRIKEVMRTAGPRMLTRHPLLTLRHWLDSRRKKPAPSREHAQP
jgi:hypothetical protein